MYIHQQQGLGKELIDNSSDILLSIDGTLLLESG